MYALPVHLTIARSVLGLALDGSEADAAKVAALDAALQKFVGRKPYHNFAGRNTLCCPMLSYPYPACPGLLSEAQ